MKRRKSVIIVSIALLVLLDLAVLGMLFYEIILQKTVDSSHVFRTVLLLGASVISIFKLFQKYEVRRSAKFYRDSYSDLIGNAFLNDPKLEKEFCHALDAFNADLSQKALSCLERLADKVTRNEDRFAIAVFTALCYDDMQAYPQAIRSYEDALRFSENSTVYSNLGICFQRVGDYDRAIEAYEDAIRMDPNNANPYNNIAQLLIRSEEYEGALAYAEKASALAPNLKAAHNARAICHAMLGNTEEYEKALRQSVMCGENRQKIEDFIRSLREPSDI